MGGDITPEQILRDKIATMLDSIEHTKADVDSMWDVDEDADEGEKLIAYVAHTYYLHQRLEKVHGSIKKLCLDFLKRHTDADFKAVTCGLNVTRFRGNAFDRNEFIAWCLREDAPREEKRLAMLIAKYDDVVTPALKKASEEAHKTGQWLKDGADGVSITARKAEVE